MYIRKLIILTETSKADKNIRMVIILVDTFHMGKAPSRILITLSIALGKEEQKVEACLKGREWAVVSQTNIGTVSKEILGELLSERVEHV